MDSTGVTVIIDPTINLGNILMGAAMCGGFLVWAVKAGGDFRVLKEQVASIVEKLDTFISRETVEEKQRAADEMHRNLQRQIDELKAR